jgi:hypothetical protein
MVFPELAERCKQQERNDDGEGDEGAPCATGPGGVWPCQVRRG